MPPPQYTPVIPPRPSPEGATSPIPEPPVIPSLSPRNQPGSPPNWARPNHPQATLAGFPGYYQTPYAQPHLQIPPGSYYIPPVALPQGGATPATAAAGVDGLSTDWEGFPGNAGAGHAAGPPPTTPWGYPGGQAAFGTPYPPTITIGGWPTPAGAPAFIPTPYVPSMAGAWTTPFAPAAQQLPPGFPQPAPPQPPHQHHASHRPIRPSDSVPPVDKFAEHPRYGPVLEAFLVKVVKAKLELNPLLAPPPDDTERPYLKWNMLFPTAQCQKSDDPAIRSWSSGRGAPATWPRIKSLRLISRSFPWDIQVTATDPEDGVTCGDVIDAIHEFMYGRVSSSQLKNATPEHTRVISQAYHHNRSTAYGVPGGKLMNTLLRCDWLGQHTMFGGIVENKRLVKDLCGGSEFPCTFELKCVQRYPMTAEEIREHEAREREAEAQQQRSRRRHSRATSRATSRASTRPPSRAPSRNGDDAEEEEEESEELV